MVNKVKLIFNTLKYIKLSQIFWQVIVRAKKKIFIVDFNNNLKDVNSKIEFSCFPPDREFYLGENEFRFLNQVKNFGEIIDWNFSGYGKLWTYNLEYFEFLHQTNISFEEKKRLII